VADSEREREKSVGSVEEIQILRIWIAAQHADRVRAWRSRCVREVLNYQHAAVVACVSASH
jgi:hypothetical protein